MYGKDGMKAPCARVAKESHSHGDGHAHSCNHDRAVELGYPADLANVRATPTELSSIGAQVLACASPGDPALEHDHETRVAIVSMDTLGIFASSLCIVHCAAMPFLVALLPLFGMQFLEGPGAHRILAFFVCSFALLAIVPGYMKHRRQDILGYMLIGLALVLYATFLCQPTLGEAWELPLISVGNILLVATHWRNRALSKCSHMH